MEQLDRKLHDSINKGAFKGVESPHLSQKSPLDDCHG